MYFTILEGTVKKIITKVNDTNSDEAKDITVKIIDYLISLGFEDFRDIS